MTGTLRNNLSNTVSRDISVNANPAPTANDDSASTGKNTAIDITVCWRNDSDSDGDTLSRVLGRYDRDEGVGVDQSERDNPL